MTTFHFFTAVFVAFPRVTRFGLAVGGGDSETRAAGGLDEWSSSSDMSKSLSTVFGLFCEVL